MKRIVGIFVLVTALVAFKSDRTSNAKHQPNDIIGTYLSQYKDSKVRVFLAMNDKYSGKVDWLKEPNDKYGNPKRDIHNPNPEKRVHRGS